MKYINLFSTYSDYLSYMTTYIQNDDYYEYNGDIPNISLCLDQNKIHYTQSDEKMYLTYDILDDNVPSSKNIISEDAPYNAVQTFNSIKIDGHDISLSDLDNNNGCLDSLTPGLHYAVFDLKDSSTIQSHQFYEIGAHIIDCVLPSGVSYIFDLAFEECNYIKNLVIPYGNSALEISEGAFFGLLNLKKIVLPANVTLIGTQAFSEIFPDSITIEAPKPPEVFNNPFETNSSCPIYVPAASVDAYKSATGWTSYASRIQAIPTT